MSLYANIFIAFVLAVGAYVQGRADGTRVTKAEYLAVEKSISTQARAKENEWQQKFAEAGKKYQRGLDANATALFTANAVKLYDFAHSSNTCKVAADPVAVDARGAELSATFADFLKREASRADSTAIRLNLCIDMLESERI